jgi:glycosyltransferase involved in cell wall biosynthesis
MSDPMRVLMLATYFPKPDNLLMGNWALAQARALKQQDLDVTVISVTSWVPRIFARSEGARAYADCPTFFDWGLPVNYPRALWYPIPPIKRWEYVRPTPFLRLAWGCVKTYITGSCERNRPDVIYAHHTGVNGYFAMRLKETFGIPYVITDHDYQEISDCDHLPNRKRFFAPIVANAYCMVGVSRRMTDEIETLFSPQRALTVHNGTDSIPQAALNSVRPQELADKIIIFSCGRFFQRKAFPDLIEAFAPVARRHPNVVLRIAGDGVERILIERRIRELQLQDRVSLLGFRSHEDVMKEMVWSDIFALTSRNEPFATVYSEALSAGKPIICCSDGGITDVVQHRTEALIIPPGDTEAGAVALEELVANSSLRRRMGEAGHALFREKLTWEHNSQVMKTLFRDAVRQAVKLRPESHRAM